MGRTHVGVVGRIWRYPVKSMQGEEIETSMIGSQGLLGDRSHALWDVKTNRIASAKNPRKWSALLDCHATFEHSPDPERSLPPVHMALPDGTTVTSLQADLNTTLSNWVGRDVEFLASVPEQPSLDQYWPDVEGTAHQDTVTQLLMPPDTFFDSCSIHVMTTSTLARLRQLYPDGAFEPSRFRPNFIIDTPSHSAEFIENTWVGHTLSIGESVVLNVDTHCPRCVVTTLAQAGLPEDLNILRTTARHNNVIAGIRLSVVQGGVIHKDDPVYLEPTRLSPHVG